MNAVLHVTCELPVFHEFHALPDLSMSPRWLSIKAATDCWLSQEYLPAPPLENGFYVTR